MPDRVCLKTTSPRRRIVCLWLALALSTPGVAPHASAASPDEVRAQSQVASRSPTVSAETTKPASTPTELHWSFQPGTSSASYERSLGLPPNSPPNAVIDAFVSTKLAERGLKFSKPAGRAALLRRLSLDLIGLPPTPEETDAFLSDKSPHAVETLVDRLLASPRYGERWGRH